MTLKVRINNLISSAVLKIYIILYILLTASRTKDQAGATAPPRAGFLTTYMHCSCVAPGLEFQTVPSSLILQMHICTLCETQSHLKASAQSRAPPNSPGCCLLDWGLKSHVS